MDQSMGMVVAMEGGQAEADGALGVLDLGHILEGMVLGPTSDRGLVPALVAILEAARLVPVLIGGAKGPGLVRATVVVVAPAIDSVKYRPKWWY